MNTIINSRHPWLLAGALLACSTLALADSHFKPAQERGANAAQTTRQQPAQSRTAQSRPAQSRLAQSRPEQSRPAQSRPPQSRPAQRPAARPDKGVQPHNYTVRDRRPPVRNSYRPAPPRNRVYVPALPARHVRYSWQGRPYYYAGGHWYRPWGSQFVLVAAPVGLFVSYLPGGYSSFWYGGTRYYYADDTYYLYEPARRGYVVTRSPYGDAPAADDVTTDDDELYVYPAQGQSEQQQADDRYECHRWAVGESGYDPVQGNYDPDRRADYLRATSACLTGRGYSVR